MEGRRYRPYVIPPEPETWTHLLERNQGTKMMMFTDDGIVEKQSNVPVEVLSPAQKRDIFTTPTQNLIAFLQSRDVPLPPDDIIDRLFVANEEDYKTLCVYGRGEINNNTYGVRLPNRLALINSDKIAKKAEELGANTEDLLCVVGIHELAHTLTYQEEWIENRGGYLLRTKAFRRDGILSRKPPKYISQISDSMLEFDPHREGLNVLQEAMIQRIVVQCLSPGQRDLLHQFDPYSDASTALEALMTELAEEPFISAAFTQDGFVHLYRTVEEKYGKGGCVKLLTVLGSPSKQPLVEILKENGFIRS